MNKKRLLQKILAGSKNVRFVEMTSLVRAFGFHLSRTEGSHHIFVHPDMAEVVNLQMSLRFLIFMPFLSDTSVLEAG